MASKESKYIVTLSAKIEPVDNDREDYSINMSIQEIGEIRAMAVTSQVWYDVPKTAMNVDPIAYIAAGFQRYLKKWLPNGVVINRDFETVDIECGYKELVRIEKAALKALTRTARLGTMMSYTLPKKKGKKEKKEK